MSYVHDRPHYHVSHDDMQAACQSVLYLFTLGLSC